MNIFKFSIYLIGYIFITFYYSVASDPNSWLNKIDLRYRVLVTNETVSSSLTNVLGKAIRDGEQVYPVIIDLNENADPKELAVDYNSYYKNFVTALITKDQLIELAKKNEVNRLNVPSIAYPTMDNARYATGTDLVQAGYLNSSSYDGENTIVVIFDTGIDYTHPDFKNESDTLKSRILDIWDQTLTPIGAENHPDGFNYGVEYTQGDINDEIDGSPEAYIRERDIKGHGTHVAGIAAGNGRASSGKYRGVAPKANIIVIKGGNENFLSTNIIDGITYAANKAVEYEMPVIVNLSLGGHYGSHDGTSDEEQAINSFSQTTGHSVVVAAGNEGSDAIHLSGEINSADKSMQLTIPPYTEQGGTGNDNVNINIWYKGVIESINLTTPSGSQSSTIPNSSSIQSYPDGKVELYHSSLLSNGMYHLAINISDDSGNAPKSGTWTITFKNASGIVDYHAWLSNYQGNLTPGWVDGNDDYSIGEPGTADKAITVGAFTTKTNWLTASGTSYYYPGSYAQIGNIAIFSSHGPTTDNRQKPEITAPGQLISSTKSRDYSPDASNEDPNSYYTYFQGTSMATPFVSGTVALLYSIDPTLSTSEIKTYLNDNASIDNFISSSLPDNIWGYGKLNVLNSIADLLNINDKDFGFISNIQATPSNYYFSFPSDNGIRIGFGTKFTPVNNHTGIISGISLYIFQSNGIDAVVGTPDIAISLHRLNESGGPLITAEKTYIISANTLTPGTFNTIDLSDQGWYLTKNPFFIGIKLQQNSPTDSIRTFSDDGTIDNETSYIIKNDNSWQATTDYFGSPSAAYNFYITTTIVTITDIIDKTIEEPLVYKLNQNYPNPFNPATTISFTMPKTEQVSLKIYNSVGQKVAVLINSQLKQGNHSVDWYAGNLASGIYFYKLQIGKFNQTKKMLLLK